MCTTQKLESHYCESSTSTTRFTVFASFTPALVVLTGVIAPFSCLRRSSNKLYYGRKTKTNNWYFRFTRRGTNSRNIGVWILRCNRLVRRTLCPREVHPLCRHHERQSATVSVDKRKRRVHQELPHTREVVMFR